MIQRQNLWKLALMAGWAGVALPSPVRALDAAPAVTYTGEASAPAGLLKLWYQRPAQNWSEALPVGNGYLGAMLFGGPTRERIQFNEHTVWTGQPRDYAHPGAVQALPELRRLLFAGQQGEAEALAMREFMSVPLRQKAYQPLGDVWIDLPQHTNVVHYRRALDLDEALHTVEYQSGGTTFRRETFDSFPDRVLVSRLTADQPGQLAGTIRLTSPHKRSGTKVEGGHTLVLRGQVETNGVAFESRLLVRTRGGKVAADGESLRVTGADEVELLLVAASNVESWKALTADPARRCQTMLSAAAARDYTALRQRHRADHQALFRRVDLDLGRTTAADLPTDQRIAGFANGHDPQLVALTFQYGRYLLLGSSREGGQPANLQGIWNDSLSPPWDSKYTCNINTEMNYWPAEVAALGECHEPLFAALGELMESGRITAREHYGARGWVLHHNFDLWRGTAPINHANHGIWVTGGAWLSLDLWEHYLFTRDRAFLRDRAYPIMKEAALFFTDYLVEQPGKGWLVSGPSNSPEQGGLVMGPTMDHGIIRSLFRACVEASQLLATDGEFAARLKALIPKIAPNQIGKHGQLQEWVEDKDDPKNHHRHVSHLWGVYPGYEINWRDTPEVWKAARQSLLYRGDAATGWSMGWKVNLWARFLDGNHAHLILRNLLQPIGATKGQGGLYPNLFDAHPPFQIDGNFGACSGIAEMLLQSQLGEIHLLPALPDAWASGRVDGLRARGHCTVGETWKDGKLVEVRLLAPAGGTFPLRYGDRQIKVELKPGQARTVAASAFSK